MQAQASFSAQARDQHALHLLSDGELVALEQQMLDGDLASRFSVDAIHGDIEELIEQAKQAEKPVPKEASHVVDVVTARSPFDKEIRGAKQCSRR